MSTDAERNPLIARSLRWAMISAFGQQSLILISTMMVLDGGVIMARYAFCLLAFWASVPLVLFRRRLTPTKVDLAIMHAGGPISCVIYFTLEFFWGLMGA